MAAVAKRGLAQATPLTSCATSRTKPAKLSPKHPIQDEASDDTLTTFRPKSQEYMDSLHAPSKEDFERIAQIQATKEAGLKNKAHDERAQSATSPDVDGHGVRFDEAERRRSPEEQLQRLHASRKIQKTFRGYRVRRQLDGFGLDANARWMSALREAQFRQSARPRAKVDIISKQPVEEGEDHAREHGSRPTSARQNWKRVTEIAKRAGHDDMESDSEDHFYSSEDSDGVSPGRRNEARTKRNNENVQRRKDAKMMGLQYFLEMVDLKHRYGSNLRRYHEEWKSSDTKENFFYWLDYGEGKNIELMDCPRDRLEREQVRYLSREERQYYLVDVDDEGRLVWRKNGARIDTTIQYRDSIHGIVPTDDPTPVFNPTAEPESIQHDASDSASCSSLESAAREADHAAKYANPEIDEAHGLKKVSHLSASAVLNKLLRKSVRKNTWIFVADTSFRLYVGIKNSGAFQHSSFLQGSRISAAGLIKVKNGRLSSLSPLSGHYRPPAANFRAFVKSLKADGVDMSHVSISKSYGILVGLEAYVKTRRKGKDLVGKVVHSKDKVTKPEEVERRAEEAKDKSQSAEKEREFLERQAREEKQRSDSKTSARMREKLKIMAIDSRGQVGP